MSSMFDLDSPLLSGLSKATDLVILNIIFVITCIPIITIGTAVTSMYEITLKMAKNEEAYIIKGYFKAFKSNFKKCTIIWFGYIILAFILLVDMYVAAHQDGQLWMTMYTIVLGFSVIVWWYFGMAFPLMGKFENTIKKSLINAGYLMVRHAFTSFFVMFFNSVLLVLIVWNTSTLVYGLLGYLVFGFATVAYVNSTLLVRIYEKYYNKEDVI